MTNFVRAANPIWWLPDLTGFPLNDEYYAFFLTNDLPYTFQPVYQDPNGINPWSAPLRFQPAGTLPNNLYFDDTLTYRIEIRHGNHSSDQLIYLIENFIPGTAVTNSNTALLSATNMITNPQFADVYFEVPPGGSLPTFTYEQSSSGDYSVNIAPGWRIDLIGSGTLTLTQGQPSGSSNFPGDPNYFIEIASTEWSSVKLIQQFNNNGAIFAGGAIAVSFDAVANGSAQTVSVQYEPSFSTGPFPDIFLGSIATGTFLEYSGAINLLPSTNTDVDGNAYVDIVFNLPSGSNISFTNIQIVGQSVNLPATFDPALDVPSYAQQTYERTVDQEFNVYKPWLFYKPIPSLLTGWDFPLNPAQFSPLGSAYRSFPPQALGINTSYYAWDQTILYQSVTSGITVSSLGYGDLTLTANATTQMAIIQYLESPQANKAIGDALAVNISATSTTASNAGIPCTVSLWYTTMSSMDFPDLNSPTYQSLVGTLDANGHPVLSTMNGTWIEVPRLIQQNATFTAGNSPSSSPSEYNDYNFMGWDLQGIADIDNATYFAIVIGTSSITTGDALHINSVGLMNGHIATRPAPQTVDQVLRECEYYFEKSYSVDVPVGTAIRANSCYAIQNIYGSNGGTTQNVTASSFEVNYKTLKRASPVFNVFDPNTGVIANYSVYQSSAGTLHGPQPVGVHWTIIPNVNYVDRISFWGDNSTLYSNNGTAMGADGFIIFHYTADSRLGIV